MSNVPQVYAAISKVTDILAKKGIGKNQRNEMQRYNYRGIDDLYNALAPALVEAGLTMLPTVTSREVKERLSRKGEPLLHVCLEVTYTLTAVSDASQTTVTTWGESMDSGDKAHNKCMSAAMKYAAIQVFAIPVVGQEDADAESPEVGTPAQVQRETPRATAPKGPLTREQKQEIKQLCDALRWSPDETADFVQRQFNITKQQLDETTGQMLIGALQSTVTQRLAEDRAKADWTKDAMERG